MKSSLQQLFILVLIFLGNHSYGQNDFFFNQYMFNLSYHNPGWVGIERQAFISLHHRTQWAGYDATFDIGESPTTQFVSLIIPIQKTFSGFGISLVNDKQPTLRSNQVRFQLSIKKELRGGTFSIGISPSINIQTLNPGDFRPSEPEDFGSKESQLKPNLHAGIFFKSKKNYSLGLSVENILEPEFSINGFDQLDYFVRTIYIAALYELGISRKLVVRSSVLIKSLIQNVSGYSFDISSVAVYRERMWGGLAFKRVESVSLLLGYSFLKNNKLKVGYSLDYIIKNRDAKESTSHEIFIKYDLPNLIFGGRKAVRTPRFTF